VNAQAPAFVTVCSVFGAGTDYALLLVARDNRERNCSARGTARAMALVLHRRRTGDHRQRGDGRDRHVDPDPGD